MTDPIYRCPTCRKPVKEDGADFPFCCERCKWVDLGEWMSESYRVSRPLVPNPTGDLVDGGDAVEDLSSEESDDD